MSMSKGKNVGRRGIHFILKDSARDLTSRDLLKIVEITEEAHAAVRISGETFRLLIGVSEARQSAVARGLQRMGFNYTRRGRRKIQGSSFALRRNSHVAAL